MYFVLCSALICPISLWCWSRLLQSWATQLFMQSHLLITCSARFVVTVHPTNVTNSLLPFLSSPLPFPMSTGYVVEIMDVSSPGYQVEKKPLSGRAGDWQPCNVVPVDDTEFTVRNLPEGQEFEFRVKAVNDGGPGKPSKSTGPHKVRDPVCEYLYSCSTHLCIFAYFQSLRSVLGG